MQIGQKQFELKSLIVVSVCALAFFDMYWNHDSNALALVVGLCGGLIGVNAIQKSQERPGSIP